jgi:hypothetical protein
MAAAMDPMSLPEADRGRLRPLAGMLRRLRGHLRYVGYRQAEEDCEVLAAKLLELFPRSELGRFTFAPIPRGGLIVLGMLSYALGLDRERFRLDPGSSGPLVVVDDCALTGARLAGFLETAASREVVAVHLYSHPDLRRAVREREARVVACLAARDLADLAPARPEEHRLWTERWRERLGSGRSWPGYWLGQPEPVGFAWNEPDRPFWNGVSGRVEDGWRFLPPHLCLKTRAALGGEPPGVPRGRVWRAPSHLVHGTFDGLLWLCDTRADQVFSLAGTGADLWRWLACWSDEAVAARRLAESYGIDPETARRETLAFAAELERAGLLERWALDSHDPRAQTP